MTILASIRIILILLHFWSPISCGLLLERTNERNRYVPNSSGNAGLCFLQLGGEPRRCRSASIGRALHFTQRNREDNYEEEEEDDDDDPPDVDVRNFRYAPNKNNGSDGALDGHHSFGLGRGRSSPSQRKAMGTSSKTTTTVFVCTNCGSESVQWRGRCPTCKEWNTFQEFAVQRSPFQSVTGGAAHNLLGPGGGLGQPMFRGKSSSSFTGGVSWLDGIPSGSGSGYSDSYGNRPVSISQIDLGAPESRRLQIPDDDEFNAVLGGGLMKGSLILLGGDPGVGKSTLALQVAAQVASLSVPPVGIGMGPSLVSSAPTTGGNVQLPVGPVWYVSGEETLEQIASRAARLASAVSGGTDPSPSSTRQQTTWSTSSLPSQLFLLSETNLNVLADQVVQAWMMGGGTHALPTKRASDDETDAVSPASRQDMPPSLLIIDSIQTMVCEAGGASSAGGISQVRESMALLLRLAKATQIPILTIGHVTKSGDVAGPRMVEHMVDAVLYLEHSQNNYRWLRAQKNRFGSCQTVGMYEFREGVLVPLPEGTEASLAPPPSDLEGCAMGICVEGPHRAMTVEVQALVTSSSSSFGKKTVEGGVSFARLSLLLGVLQKHCHIAIAGGGKGLGNGRDVYVNVVGCAGVVSKSQQASAATALDLAVSVALASSHLRIPVRGDTAFIAQVGLLGELRSVTSLEPRLLQAQRMGFSRVILAAASKNFSTTTKGSKTRKRDGEKEESVRRTRKFDMDIFECSTLHEALKLSLVSPLPNPKLRMRTATGGNQKGSLENPSPGSLHELQLQDEILLDDDEDEYDVE
jgi:DNA repair protein RadA/Sms